MCVHASFSCLWLLKYCCVYQAAGEVVVFLGLRLGYIKQAMFISLLFVIAQRQGHTMALHKGHAFSPIAPILFRSLIKCMCWVLGRKMVDWSFLSNLLISSFTFGEVICSNKPLPVFPRSHSFSNSSLKCDLMICFAVSNVVGVAGCSCLLT